MKMVRNLKTNKVYEYVAEGKWNVGSRDVMNVSYVVVKKHCYGSTQYDPNDTYQLIELPLNDVEIFEK